MTVRIRRCRVHATEFYRRLVSKTPAAAVANRVESGIGAGADPSTTSAYVLFEMDARRYCVPLGSASGDDRRGPVGDGDVNSCVRGSF